MKATKNSRKQVREQLRQEVLDWYLQHSGLDPTDPSQDPQIAELCSKIQFCEDKKAYASTVLYWIEPPIPGVRNPVVVEEDIQGIWSAKVVPMRISIKSFGGLPQ